MADQQFLVNIDLKGNEIKNARLENLVAPPALGFPGQLVLDSTALTLKYYTTALSSAVTIQEMISFDVSASPYLTASIAGGVITLAIADADGTNSGLLSSADWSILDAGTELATAGTLVIRDANGDAAFNALTVAGAPTADLMVSTKKYVDDSIAAASVPSYNGILGDGTATSFAVAHGLSSTAVIIQITETVGGAVVFPSVAITNSTTVTVEFNVAPALDEYTIDIK